MLDRLIIEATEYEFKVAVEKNKPKSWLKSVSAFANGIGGTLFFGVSDDRTITGLDDAQADAEAISRLIKDRITPLVQFVLTPFQENNKNLLALTDHSWPQHAILLQSRWYHGGLCARREREHARTRLYSQ